MSIKQLLSIFFVSRALFFLFAIASTGFIGLNTGYLGSQFDPSISNLFSNWANFDGRHFLSIATQGYHNTNFAYLPLYPVSISLVGYVIPLSHIYIGILLSSLAFLLGLYFLYKITILDYNQKIALNSILFCCFFPLSFFYHSVYADAFFFLFTILSFYFARKGNWLLSGVFGCLSLLTRLAGIALIPALLIEWYHQKKGRKINLRLLFDYLKTGFIAVFLTSIGLLFYMVYLQLFFGDFLLFQKSMSAWDQAGVVFPLQVVYRYLKIFLNVTPHTLVFWVAVLEFIATALYFMLAYYVARRVRTSYGVFMMVLLMLVPFTGTLAGTPRYMLHLFPGFIALAVITSPKPRLRKGLLLLLLAGGFILTALFTRGYFIA